MNEQIIWSPGITIRQMEKMIIQAALRSNSGHQKNTAKMLGIAERTIQYKIAQYEKEDAAFKAKQEKDDKERQDYLKRARGPMPTIETMGTKETGETFGLMKKSEGIVATSPAAQRAITAQTKRNILGSARLSPAKAKNNSTRKK